MAWRQERDKPLSEPVVWRINASLSFDEWTGNNDLCDFPIFHANMYPTLVVEYVFSPFDTRVTGIVDWGHHDPKKPGKYPKLSKLLISNYSELSD